MERFRRIASPRNASHFGELQLLDLKVEVPASRLVVEDPKAVKHGAILEIFFVQFEGHRRLIQRGRDESLLDDSRSTTDAMYHLQDGTALRIASPACLRAVSRPDIMPNSTGAFNVERKVVALATLVFRWSFFRLFLTIKSTKVESTVGGRLLRRMRPEALSGCLSVRRAIGFAQ